MLSLSSAPRINTRIIHPSVGMHETEFLTEINHIIENVEIDHNVVETFNRVKEFVKKSLSRGEPFYNTSGKMIHAVIGDVIRESIEDDAWREKISCGIEVLEENEKLLEIMEVLYLRILKHPLYLTGRLGVEQA